MHRRVAVVLGDENPRTRSGLKAVLETFSDIEIVGEASNDHETFHMVEQMKPDVVLLDLKQPIDKGLHLVRTLRERWPLTRIIALSMYMSYQGRAVQAGVDTFLLKGVATSEIVQSIVS
jgi:DNA-binding NarL/FixJ family response regulator